MTRLTNGRLFWGLLVTALGVIWLLNNLEITHVRLGELIARNWPVILIYYGLVGAANAVWRGSRSDGRARGILWGSLIINGLMALVGILYLGNYQGWFQVDVAWVWRLIVPLVILAGGALLLRSGVSRPGARTHWFIMSGAEVVPQTWEDTAVISFWSGAEIDMTHAGLPEHQEVLIDLFALMGGVDIKMPENLPLTCEWTSLMGGMEINNRSEGAVIDHRVITTGEAPRVRVRAVTIMGAVDIKIRTAKSH